MNAQDVAMMFIRVVIQKLVAITKNKIGGTSVYKNAGTT